MRNTDKRTRPIHPNMATLNQAEQRRTVLSTPAPSIQAASPVVSSEIKPSDRSFTSSVPYERREADCLVVACSSHHFEKQTREFLAMHLGFSRPHVIQFPTGAALSLPLVGTYNYLSKAVDLIAEKAAKITNAKTVILVAHENCSGYENENGRVIDWAASKLFGKSVRDLQIEHIRKAKLRLQSALRGVTIQAFFADVIGEGEVQRVKFIEIQ